MKNIPLKNIDPRRLTGILPPRSIREAQAADIAFQEYMRDLECMGTCATVKEATMSLVFEMIDSQDKNYLPLTSIYKFFEKKLTRSEVKKAINSLSAEGAIVIDNFSCQGIVVSVLKDDGEIIIYECDGGSDV